MAVLFRPIHQADLLLPKVEFDALIASFRDRLYVEDSHWLNEWEYYDQTHEMDDSARAEARRHSYSAWYKKLRESLVAAQ
jgi:hypothetical protein